MIAVQSVHAQNTAAERKPLFAVKTNLLFDAVTALNAEAEVPLGSRWSVAAEWVFPWWLLEERQYAMQIGAGTLEARYWFPGRKPRGVMTGWFAGIYGGGGYYDIEWGNGGDQGEFFHAGVSGGYAHPIGRNGNWRMEYSLGLGYMGSKYRGYAPESDTEGRYLLLRRKGEYTWTGPTRAKISLVWMIGRAADGKGGGR